MPKIFISYRRADSEFPAHSICKALREQFDPQSVFIDVDTVPPGVDFRREVHDQVGRCDVLLAIIGQQAEPRAKAGRPEKGGSGSASNSSP